MNMKQTIVLDMLRRDERREVYEGAGENRKIGNGLFWVSFPEGELHQPLNVSEVKELVDLGYIRERFPGFYSQTILLRSNAAVHRRGPDSKE